MFKSFYRIEPIIPVYSVKFCSSLSNVHRNDMPPFKHARKLSSPLDAFISPLLISLRVSLILFINILSYLYEYNHLHFIKTKQNSLKNCKIIFKKSLFEKINFFKDYFLPTF